ncbi:hypothetical protein COM21_12790 [Bacillus toyonensis]|nr:MULTISPECIES: hypothetical protein [Bacillus cereus group]OFD06722.1 hypothetical protein BTGOE7_31160 [Bacillus thuringiensis]MBJ8049829.1 hypothetical protein [Bacillus cereus group sp. N18]MBJ8063607.1 hypothetical protein [Bacillus cereus group sp. N15]PED22115.1 hypothetical protein CON63_04550 [Bacillus toyonensis]PEE83459.1 hypothetical protein COO15_07580 [Bacillus toyonensis]
MSLDKYKNMSDEEFKQLSTEEFQNYIKLKQEDFSRHYRKINEITVDVMLKPQEAIEIAKHYHKKNKLDGVVNEDINQLFFDEAYTFKIEKENRNNDDIRPAWRILVDLPKNPFLMEDYTLIVSDRDKKVMGILDPNGHPVFKDNEFTDEDIEYIMSDEDSKD